MNPRVKELIDKEIAAFETAIRENKGQPLTRYELAVIRSYLRYRIEREVAAASE
jgi:hypothetical protein